MSRSLEDDLVLEALCHEAPALRVQLDGLLDAYVAVCLRYVLLQDYAQTLYLEVTHGNTQIETLKRQVRELKGNGDAEA